MHPLPRRVLVLGVPRSGTTWIGRVLGACEGARYVHEPDGVHEPFAYVAKYQIGAVPVLRVGDVAADYERLWAGAFGGGEPDGGIADRLARRLYAGITSSARATARETGRIPPRLRLAMQLARPRRPAACSAVVAKSVDAALAAEWIAQRFEPAVLVVRRDLRSVLASWLELGMGNTRAAGYDRAVTFARREWGIDFPAFDAAPPLERSAVVCATWAHALDAALARNPTWHILHHEAACRSPRDEFLAAAHALGLDWGEHAEATLRSSEGVGEGFTTKRVAAEQVDSWKRRLDAEQVAIVERVVARYAGV